MSQTHDIKQSPFRRITINKKATDTENLLETETRYSTLNEHLLKIQENEVKRMAERPVTNKTEDQINLVVPSTSRDKVGPQLSMEHWQLARSRMAA